MKICILSFSGRSGGSCGCIANLLKNKLAADNEIDVYYFSEFVVSPCGHCSYECFSERENCPHFAAAFSYHICEDTVPDILFFSAKKFGKISINGDLTESNEVKEAAFRFVEEL